MWEEYELTLHAAMELRNEEYTDLAAMKKMIASIKDEIRKLGDVNVNAIEDYKEISERYGFLKTQHDDLVEAEKTLVGIIEELDTGTVSYTHLDVYKRQVFGWILCWLTSFLAGPATTALYYAVNKVIRHGRSYLWKEYWHAFKSNFKQAALAALILTGVVLFLGCLLYTSRCV